MPEEQPTRKGPFSPLQTGCAFVMLTNMLLYLCVVAFVFNLLDPSKLDPTYLLKRGFTTPKDESPQDRTFRRMAEDKKKEQQQIRAKSMDQSVSSPKLKSSSAGQLSKIDERKRASNWGYKKRLPVAALTQNFRGGDYENSSAAKSRQNLIPFPRATLGKSYRPSYPLPSTKTIALEPYDTIAVELAHGVSIPLFTIPEQNDNQTNNSSPAPPPATQSRPLQTNRIKNNPNTERIEPPKDG